ncbi:MAG: putative amidohydrolase [Rhizorhabdus sp.]|nr:putative amidohydrolase [Rhizorhabdus sp.]
MTMDIIDTQVHFNKIGSLDAGMAAMDAVGVAGVMFEEWSHFDEEKRPQPGELLPNGEFRPLCPLAEAAAGQFPSRFGVLRRVGYRDPDLDAIARQLADAPYTGALRVLADTPETLKALHDGEMDRLFAIAAKHGLPLFVLTNGRADVLERHARLFPGLSLVIDHCGLAHEKGSDGKSLDDVLKLARFPNVIVKWSHATYFLAGTSYPFGSVIPFLRRALDAFGERRIMWGSDFTINYPFATWAEQLFYIRDSEHIGAHEKEWILGRTARNILGWESA